MGEKSLSEAYLLAITPIGLFGGLHFYLGRYHMGLLYLCTIGVFGLGYIIDLFRAPWLVKEANMRSLNKQDPTQPLPLDKSVIDAYLMWFPLGLFGLHHVYLKKRKWALLYLGSVGLLVVGWLVDSFWIVSMVREANRKSADPEERVRRENERAQQEAKKERKKSKKDNRNASSPDIVPTILADAKSLATLASKGKEDSTNGIEGGDEDTTEKRERHLRGALALGLSPLGILGAHHYYLRRKSWGILYTATAGLLLLGWLMDWFRLYFLTERSNAVLRGEKDKREKTLDDAYVLWFPWGIIGAHHFYLGRTAWGFLYLATLGLFGMGWILDGFRMPMLVKESNQRRVDNTSTAHSEDVGANITPAADDYDDNSVTVIAGDSQLEGATTKEGTTEVDDLPEVTLTSLKGMPNLTGDTEAATKTS